MKEMTDYKELCEQMKRGNTKAGYALFLATVKPVFYLVLKKTGSASCARFIVRDSYILNLRHLSSLKHPVQYPVWAEKMAISEAERFIKNRERSLIAAESVSKPDEHWDEQELEDLNISEELARLIWDDILKGLAGLPLEKAPINTARPISPQELPSATKDPSKTPGGKGKMQAMLGAARRLKKKWRLIIAAAAIFALAAAVGMGSFFAKRIKGANISGINSLYRDADNARLLKIAGELSSQLSGQLGELCKCGEDIYSLVIYLNTEQSGGMINYTLSDTEKTEANDPKESADKERDNGESGGASKEPEHKYLRLDYAASKKYPREEASIEAKGNKAGSGGRLLIREELLDEIIESAEDAGGGFSLLLSLRCRNVNLTKPVELSLDPSLLQLIGDEGRLEIALNDSRHMIKLSKQQLGRLCEEYGLFTLNYQAENNRVYKIRFLSSEGREIEELYGDISFVLPAESELSYICASYSGGKSYADGSENRGGSFDKEAGTISFEVSRSGRYELIGEEALLFDIAELDEETKKAAEFMASMEFIKAIDGNFRAQQPIKRGELVAAVGQMFLKTDKSRSVDFRDVLPSDPAYDFLAASVDSSIVQGYEDSSFGGELPASRQELLTICAKTLVAKNICEYPKDPESLLSFSDKSNIAGYAKEPAALAVQQQLIPATGSLRPEAAASRGFAALVLYKMYQSLDH